MDKLKMESANLTQKNIDKIAELFPNVLTEMLDENGRIKRGINFDLLKQELAEDLVDGQESYDFTWVGKNAAKKDADTPIRKTLRPCLEESKDWETTGNLYIEGDNLDVLKLLQESYLGQVKMIFIDPPYNTGNDFIYRDNFSIGKEDYEEQIGLFDEEENRLFRNTETNGRFHSDWCSLIYPRLKVAKKLLSEDGVIFISIDDNEVANLKKICDEVFGEEHFIGCFVWRRRTSSALADKLISTDHEYVLAYEKANFISQGVPKGYSGYSNPDNDPRGDWRADNLTVGMSKDQRPNQYYVLVDPATKKEYAPNPNRVWAYIPSSMARMIEENRIIFPSDITRRPMVKRFKDELKIDVDPCSTWLSNVGLNSEGTRDLQEILGGNLTIYPKPVSLLSTLLKAAISKSDIVLDFFSGSATTAHAVMRLNAEDGGSRKFIMVQLPEETDEQSVAALSGFKNICEIGKERIRRIGEKIKAEIKQKNVQPKLDEDPLKVPDIGFRVLKVDSTNMKEVFYAANLYNQEMLAGLESNIKEDRSDLDLLYGVMLDWGLQLSLSHKMEEINGVKVHIVDEGSLVACFAERVSEEVVRAIAKKQPLRVVFRDGSFKNSADKINIEEIFKLLAPNTTVKVL